jgi:tetratricopeptide (TPR) repeat protein
MTPEAEAQYKAATAFSQAGNHIDALKPLNRAVEIDPTDPRYWIGLGVSHLNLYHWKEAIRALSRGIELKPHYAEADARMFLADAFVALGDIKSAEEQWRIVISMMSTYPSHEAPMEDAHRLLEKHSKATR